MTGDTANISIIADHAWYDWIKFYDPVGKQFPEEKMYLGRYLVLAIDVGPALTANVFNSNVEVVHRSTYHSLIPEEFNYDKGLMHILYVVIEYKLCQKAAAKYFGDMGLEETPTFEKY